MKKSLFLAVAVCAALVAALVFAAELKVEQAVICKSVVDRQPVEAGDKFPAAVGKLYCFTKVSGAQAGTKIRHVWLKGDQEMLNLELNLGDANWRTWSSKTLDKSGTGAWRVEVRNAEGAVLSTVNFTVE